jgi:hypothetical protein
VRQRHLLPSVFTVPKVEGQRNEDKCRRSSKGIHALSDGASISFDSASWARILVRRFAQNPEFTLEWLSSAIAEFNKLYDRESLPWMKQASFDKGSFASLLGVRLVDEGKMIQVLAIGDSLAVLCDGDHIKATFPYFEASQFDKSPQLLSTNPAENTFLATIDVSFELNADWTFSGLERPALLCMTDALGQWLLSSRDAEHSPIAILRNLKTHKAFTHFVQAERASGRMRRDDTTLLAIW